LVDQLMAETRRRASRAAGQLRFRIVDWNSDRPDAEAQSRLLEVMNRDDNP
jgi:hypothetical protein